MTQRVQDDRIAVAELLIEELKQLRNRIAVRPISYSDFDPSGLEIRLFRVPDDQRIEVEALGWEIVFRAELKHGFAHMLVFVHGSDVSEELEAALTASAMASWAPDS